MPPKKTVRRKKTVEPKIETKKDNLRPESSDRLLSTLSNCHKDSCALCVILRGAMIVFLSLFIYWLGLVYGVITAQNSQTVKDLYILTPEMHKVVTDKQNKKMSQGMSESSMEQMIGDMMTELENKQGTEFDQEFMIQMTVHHEGAVKMAQMALDRSSDPQVRELALRIIESQSSEILEMRSWQPQVLE